MTSGPVTMAAVRTVDTALRSGAAPTPICEPAIPQVSTSPHAVAGAAGFLPGGLQERRPSGRRSSWLIGRAFLYVLAVARALEMPLSERQERHSHILATLSQNSSDMWGARFLQSLEQPEVPGSDEESLQRYVI
jgi:hypothetical protein